jgi:hypothetical protein
MKHDVVLFMPVKIKFAGIEADSHFDAIHKAEKMLSQHDITPRRDINETREHGTLVYMEAEDECVRALVDEEGDEDYERSLYYVPKGDGCWRVEGDDPPTHFAIWYTGGKGKYKVIPFRHSGAGEPQLDDVIKQLKIKLKREVDKRVRIERIKRVPVVVRRTWDCRIKL